MSLLLINILHWSRSSETHVILNYNNTWFRREMFVLDVSLFTSHWITQPAESGHIEPYGPVGRRATRFRRSQESLGGQISDLDREREFLTCVIAFFCLIKPRLPHALA